MQNTIRTRKHPLTLHRETVRTLAITPSVRAMGESVYCPSVNVECPSVRVECNTYECETVASVFMSCETFPVTVVTLAGCTN